MRVHKACGGTPCLQQRHRARVGGGRKEKKAAAVEEEQLE
jgi:hypothetical protein